MYVEDAEYDLLLRLRMNPAIPREEWALADSLSAQGFLAQGYEDRGETFQHLGHLTPLGRRMMKSEMIHRNRFLRFLHSFFLPFL